jgi:hypothetical protein
MAMGATSPRLPGAARPFRVTLSEEGSLLTWDRTAQGVFGLAALDAIGQPAHNVLGVPRRLLEAARLRANEEGRGVEVEDGEGKESTRLLVFPLPRGQVLLVGTRGGLQDRAGERLLARLDEAREEALLVGDELRATVHRLAAVEAGRADVVAAQAFRHDVGNILTAAKLRLALLQEEPLSERGRKNLASLEALVERLSSAAEASQTSGLPAGDAR